MCGLHIPSGIPKTICLAIATLPGARVNPLQETFGNEILENPIFGGFISNSGG